MMHPKIQSRALPAALVCALLAACGGSSKVGELGQGRPELISVEIGRLVDVYSFRRIDESNGDRRVRTNRQLELVARNIVVNAGIETQSLFDSAGNAVPTANYELMPFDKNVGHEELLILWDDRKGPEGDNFAAAFAACQGGLASVPPSYRGQNTGTRPIPVVPRNASIKLTFSSPVNVDAAFFAANPSALQLLEFKGDPGVVSSADAFRLLPYRVIPQDSTIILDTTILGGEGPAGGSVPGMPVSSDSVTANIRVAIPSRGQVVPTFYVKEDPIAEMNSVDSVGRVSVIRDFRSGNLADGIAGRLREPEAPMIVASLSMGLTEVNVADNTVTLNKRTQFVPVRGRYPFVDGPLKADGVPMGPLFAPVQSALPHGDFVTQVVDVEMPDGSNETVLLRAEVLQNLEVGTVVGDPDQPVLGLAANAVPPDSGQGETLVARLRLSSAAPGRDSLGRPVAFQANAFPEGRDCVLRAHYYEEIPFTSGSAVLSDAAWRGLFARIEPKPTQLGVNLQPSASVSVEFTKPMDLDQVDNTANFLITNTPSSGAGGQSFAAQMSDAKQATLHVVPTRLSDLAGDGTILRLQPPIGFFHRKGQAEAYCLHVQLGLAGVTDLAGNSLKIFDNPNSPVDAWSVDFSMATDADDNLVGWISQLFTAEDGDGSLPGSADFFGQYRLEQGRLIAASTVRFARSADRERLSTVSRVSRGECWDELLGVQLFPVAAPQPPFSIVPVYQGAAHPGILYWTPFMSSTIGPQPTPAPSVYPDWQTLAQPVGRIVEPLKPQGSRMQMRYLEDDFGLSYRQPSEFGIDIEQLYWAPFNGEDIQYDVFDRFSMSLSHCRTRPDERWLVDGGLCGMDCASMNSSLSNVFTENVLEGSTPVPVFEDKIYAVNPNEAFSTNEQVKFVPFPRFDRTYTWRDSRLVTKDASGAVIGLGGALQPQSASTPDRTASGDSPWVPDVPVVPVTDPPTIYPNPIWVRDVADFAGFRLRDHDPIALPLLVDFSMFAENIAGDVAKGANGFQVALLGPPPAGFPGAPNAGGYYDSNGSGCGGPFPWPRVRVHASGSNDLSGTAAGEILIDPANQLTAQGNIVKDAGLGAAATALFPAPAGDGMLHWMRADFLRKTSTVTFGFFDTQRPQFSSIANIQAGTIVTSNGFPDLTLGAQTVPPTQGLPELRIGELIVQMDPPQARQPAGTSVVVEIRGADSFDNSDSLYNPSFAGTGPTPLNSDEFDVRGNLLNPNYACEAYRYSTANFGPDTGPFVPRVTAEGLTKYVTEDELGQIRNPATGLLPRFLNLRLAMTNNTTVSPALSPSLRSLSVVYRMQPIE